MELTDRFYEALDFAARAHRGQERKSHGVPYVAHLLAVASLVMEHGNTEDEAIAALLRRSPRLLRAKGLLWVRRRQRPPRSPRASLF